ncbi:MAG: glycosyltransferase family 4 protein [Desulfococcaceae bacterium]|nr:glycosyltransferase family 4 protein [Desulfococcaceae bacterium]
MKIALVCHQYSLRKGGLEKDTVLFSRELRKRGHEVHIFANRRDDRDNTDNTASGIVFHHVPVFPFTSPGKNLSFALNAQRKLAETSFDIIQGMDRILRQDIFRVSDGINPVQMQNRYPHPLIRGFFAATPRRMALTWLEQQIFRKGGCRTVLAISRVIKNEIIRHYHVKPEHIRVIYNGVDTEIFHPGLKELYRKKIREEYGIGEEEMLLLFISNDHKRKNLSALLRALQLLLPQKFRLMVIGSDRSEPYRQQSIKMGIGDQLLFTGHQRQIESFFGASDIFVFPSHYDAFGNVCLEAMAAGLPLICSRTCGASELIRNGVNGFILEQKRPEELAEKISMLKNHSLRKQIGRQAARDAGQYSIENHMSEVLDLYRHIIRSKKESHAGNIFHSVQ